MNTRFAYFYRSPSNTKKWGAVVFSGVADESIEQRLTGTLESFEFFIADQVRVPELFFHDGLTPEEDKCWHEFASLEVTTEEVTDRMSRSIEEFVAECEAAAREGWRAFDPKTRETGGYR
jgi:hypothetical protein